MYPPTPTVAPLTAPKFAATSNNFHVIKGGIKGNRNPFGMLLLSRLRYFHEDDFSGFMRIEALQDFYFFLSNFYHINSRQKQVSVSVRFFHTSISLFGVGRVSDLNLDYIAFLTHHIKSKSLATVLQFSMLIIIYIHNQRSINTLSL
jgi:hypothetical protein